MSIKKGTLQKCDRCGFEEFFEAKEKIIDDCNGGFIKTDEVEALKEWATLADYGHICPDCSKEYIEMLNLFMTGEKYHDPSKCRYYYKAKCMGTKEMDPCQGERCKQWKER